MKRRDFLKMTILGTASPAAGIDVARAAELATGVPAFPPVPVYRTVGRTRLKVALVSFGAMLTPEPEEIVGKALKGCRDKIIVATKTKGKSVTPEAIIDDVETSVLPKPVFRPHQLVRQAAAGPRSHPGMCAGGFGEAPPVVLAA